MSHNRSIAGEYPGFLILIRPYGSKSAQEDLSIQLPCLSIKLKNVAVHIFYSSSDLITVDNERNIVLLFMGEDYSNTKKNDHKYIIDGYLCLGESFVNDLNGSFSLILVDKNQGLVIIATDRINSRKLFFTKARESIAISTSIYMHPLPNAKLDMAAIACYLANGALHNDYTFFRDVKILDRACIYKYERGHLQKRQYWSYRFTNSYSNRPHSKLKKDLSDLLVESVSKRIDDTSPIYLSASAGYDATGILGILSSTLKIPRVNCFSYAHGKILSSSDEHISAKMSKRYGYSHEIIPSFNGDLVKVIKENADMGQGIAHICHEADAWITMGEKHQSEDKGILLTGDECFGWLDHKISSPTDALLLVDIQDFNGLEWLKEYLISDVYNMLLTNLNEDIQRIKKACQSFQNLHDMKDYLYLDQRLNHVILPWRENFAGRFFTVANPFLDNEILNFMTNVPSDLRLGKKLYKDTIKEMFPELFKFRRARSASFTSYWRGEVYSQKRRVEALINDEESFLDEVIPRDAILRILKDYRYSEQGELLSRSKKILRRMVPHDTVLYSLACNYRKLRTRFVSKAAFFERVLVLRCFLASAFKISNKNSQNYYL